MTIDQVRFKLKPLYDRWGIRFEQAKAEAIYPDGDESVSNPFVSVEYTESSKKGTKAIIEYDYLINATGPKLNFDATEGSGPS